MIPVDITLARRLESTEAQANSAFVESRAAMEPDSRACWIDVGGTFAMFDGIGSPLTQTFGLGVCGDGTDEVLVEIERFFSERGADVCHEVSPLADPELLGVLGERNYRPIEHSTVLVREIDEDDRIDVEDGRTVITRIVSSDEIDLWAATAAAGWADEGEELSEFIRNFGRISANARGAFPYIAEIDGKAAGTGSLLIYDDVALLAGASTLPEFRRRGAQSALLTDRLNFAADLGCRYAMIVAAPGSQSQKNAQRNGFQIAYTRTKWQLFAPKGIPAS